MLSKSEKIWIKSLKDRKTRYLQSEFIAEGSKIVLDLIKVAPGHLKLLCATSEWYSKFESVLLRNADKVRIISEDLLQSISSLVTTEEVIAIFSFPDISAIQNSEDRLIIYLDKIRDPGNLGAIIRSADWFGIPRLFCSPDCVDPFNNKCVQATMSSIMRVQVLMKTWEEMLEAYSLIDKYAATTNGISMYDVMKDSVKFVCVGNESNGLSTEILKSCQKTISIPRIHSLGAESLNAAIACSLIMGWKTFGGK